MKNKSLRTFQIEDSVWNQFRMKAGSTGKSASSVLVELVNNYINSTPDQIDNTATNYITYIDDQIDELRSELLGVIEELKLDRANITGKNYITSISNRQTGITPINETEVEQSKDEKELVASSNTAKIGILSGAALMVRFGKKSSNSSYSAYRQKGKEAFMEWSQRNDPDGYSWWVVDESDPKKGYQIVSVTREQNS